jgi:hypothetical protein
MNMAHRSRWGWHPCDRATYLLLKKLHGYYWRALRRFAEWQRWRRKQPQNRVIRAWIRDDEGNRVASRIVGPRPEPPLCPVFCTRAFVVRHGKEERLGERVSFCGHGIAEAYRAARTLLADPEKVQPLSLSSEEIRRLAAQVEEVYGQAT